MLSEADYTRCAQLYMDTVFRVAFGYLKSASDADDVTQAVFLRLWKRRPDFESEAHAKHWLLRVAINESKRLLCSPWRKTEPLDGCETQALPSAAHQELLDIAKMLDDADHRAHIDSGSYKWMKQSLAELTAKTAKLAYKEGISLKDACVKLGFLTPDRFDEVLHPEEMA